MSIQQENAEIVQEVIRTAAKLDATLREFYKTIDLTIREEKDGSCVVNISPSGIARCRGDGSVWLLNHPDNQPFVGEVPVMIPLDRDSFALAMLYLSDLNYLFSSRKKKMDKILGKESLPESGFGGSGGLFS